MIKKILVALDPDSDTPVATQYAVDIARRYGARVTGLAVIDMDSIEAGSRGAGIGAMFYAEKLRERLTTEARNTAHQLISEFAEELEGTGVPHGELLQEGVPFRRIIEDMKYHDLLIVGDDPHFFYSHPKQKTETLAHIVNGMIAPTLVVGRVYRSVETVMIAYDGSASAARAMRRFTHHKPFGDEVKVHLFHAHGGDEAESDLLLQLAQEYLQTHGLEAQVASREASDANAAITQYASDIRADIIVAGAHSVSKFRRMAFGSTTSTLVEKCPLPLYLDS